MYNSETWAIILAAGKGQRMGDHTIPKQFMEWEGYPLYWHSALAFARCAFVSRLIFVFPEEWIEAQTNRLKTLQSDLGLPWLAATGGSRRQDSVANALKLIPAICGKVFVHDAARPFLKPDLIIRLHEALSAPLGGVIPALPVTDTIKTQSEGIITGTPDRSKLVAVQTPQLFYLKPLKDAYSSSVPVTDDASLMENAGHKIGIIPGDPDNIKITYSKDLEMLHKNHCRSFRNGFGYDVHKYGGDRPLKLGGVTIPCEYGIYAHSDGDICLHALMDAILGCICLGDIGKLFPESDERFTNISSAILLVEVLSLARENKFQIQHVDLTIVAQKPRIAPFRDEIRKNVARLLSLDPAVVNVKATTEEGLGFTGRVEGIKCYALVSGMQTETARR